MQTKVIEVCHMNIRINVTQLVRLLSCCMLNMDMLICLCLVKVKSIVSLNTCVLLRVFFIFFCVLLYDVHVK